VKEKSITVRWKEGLHARPAARLVQRAKAFKATIELKYRGNVANARSIISILLLCATLGSTINIEISGEDEEQAMEAIEAEFNEQETGS
jgi:phosphotransferase system HPr (HPr) family protein